jgi:tRNA pseudouridine55 synthase
MTDGLVIVDKPGGMTSHDVVARMRRIAKTRKVGHAGTLDPMATGVLILGLGQATRLLGHLAMKDKSYDATIRLGVTTTTDDAEGEVVETRSAERTRTEDIETAVAALTGDIQQVPSSVSAIKVDGVRAYKRVREGAAVVLQARPVTVSEFEMLEHRPGELDVRVTCSTGTYVRALARDLGAALGVGAHLTALRRTRVGSFTLEQARTLEQLEQQLEIDPLAHAAGQAFASVTVDDETAARITHGQRVPMDLASGPSAVFDEAGRLVALVEPKDPTDPNCVAQPIAVFARQADLQL